jgi:hypothetical protein
MWSADGESPVKPVYQVPRPADIFKPTEAEDVSEDVAELSAQFDE